MGDAIDAEGESIDNLIQWLRLRRTADPDAPLTDLLSCRSLDPSRLVDLACVDLIERRRRGQAVTVEHYLQAFPSLRRQSTRLDLIDAELCVTRELGHHADPGELIGRFPDLASPIRELLTLDVAHQPSPPLQFDASHVSASRGIDASNDAVSPLACDSLTNKPTQDDLADSPFPVALPPWFIAAKTIAQRPGKWLIRGRDSKRGIALAMKVIELPLHIMRSQCDQALAACEAAARVQNRNWITPIVAAVVSQRLAVIRPWIFANPWPIATASPAAGKQMNRQLSAVAFTLQAAHDMGATHGAVHVENLLIDHHGRIQIVDAICSGIGLPDWLGCCDPSESDGAQLQRRIALDTQCLIDLVAEHGTPADRSQPTNDLAELRRIAAEHPGEACGRIGDFLVRSFQ